MAGRKLLIIVALGVFVLSGPATAQQDEIAQLQRMFETDIRLFNGQDPAAFTVAAHDQAVLFGTLTPFAVEGKAAIQQLIRQYFADHDYAKWEPIDAKFSITGTSALAWGHYTLREQRRVGPRRVLHGRYTFTYTKQADEWLLVALDFSPLS
jgi:ketosteroid isomerase-like protein